MTADHSIVAPIATSDGDDPAACASLCPGCGYDLRGATSDRCTECGLAIDRAAAAASGVPWAHRRQIGRVRAFLRTVGDVTFDRRRIRYEMGRPQAAGDARRFRAWNATALAAALIGAAAVAAADYGLANVVTQSHSFGGRGWQAPYYIADAAVPWSAGVALVPALPFYLAALAIHLTGVGRSMMRLKTYPSAHRERARAMGLYAAAPLAWLLPAAALYAATSGLGVAVAEHESLLMETLGAAAMLIRALQALTGVLAGLFAAAGLLGVLYRTAGWVARAHHAGAGRLAAALVEVIVRVLLGIVLFVGVLPWCVGMIWMVFDSIR